MRPFVSNEEAPLFLLSVDVEDPARDSGDGTGSKQRVAEATGRFLDFLSKHEATGTFFVTGEVARALPALVRRIAEGGHEIGCHSDLHMRLEKLGPEAFREDCLRALAALRAAGADRVRGYRAPCFSLTAATAWAHPILAELGFTYSSSVLPARNPISGWPGFGTGPAMAGSVVELPVTLLADRLLPVPCGGVYFRALPRAIVLRALRVRARNGGPVLAYLHPYDVDHEQPRFAYPGFSRHGLYNRLMFRGRAAVFPRLEEVARIGFRFAPYGPYAEAARAALGAEAGIE